MFTDTIGAVDVAGVYCTLCGSVVIYETQHDGTQHTLGTSGFLYRSNKLMYDEATQSFWSTLKGEPMVGPLVDRGIKLDQRAVVTTTWGQWKAMHPATQVLSLDTGYERDYGEGVAYADYFATDSLMFFVPQSDRSLKNKDEVMALRFGSRPVSPTAISTQFLAKNPLYHGQHGGVPYVVITDESGASRIFERPEQLEFESYGGSESVRDVSGGQWHITAEALVSDEGQRLKRLPAHRAFWFGWHAAFPDTVLIR